MVARTRSNVSPRDDVIGILGLAPHPEGGHFRETFRDAAEPGRRAASTAIYFFSRPASNRTGTRSTPQKLGTSMPAMPCCWRCRRRRSDHRPFAWAPTRGRRTTAEPSFRKAIGNEPGALANGRSSAAPSRPPSRSTASRSLLRTSLLARRRGWIERRRSNSATSFERYPPLVPRRKFFGRGAMAFNPRDNCRFGS